MKYTTEQIAAIISFANDFTTWANTQIDKEITNITEIAFAVTPKYRAKVEGITATYSKCLHHLKNAVEQIVAENFGKLLK